jgi:hypothetical protein
MIRVKIDNSQLNFKIAAQTKALAALPAQGLKEFKNLTPIRSGNARSNTDLTGNNQSIVGNYPYAKRLDNNSSPQTRGRGIVNPFKDWWIKQLNIIARMK